MRHSKTGQIRPNRLSYAVSLAVLTLAASNAALAQQSPAGAGAEVTPSTTVLVVGTRLSQQSSIDRKKGAATAMDSIVAEDVGSLPDRNVGEAISRMAGIVLDRGDFGEGVSVSVRGNGADLTRIELDGQGVQSAGGIDQGATTATRGVELRQLSADLIKSVDVVKGSTADMTEGALGGGIIIKTRTGLDFKKPFASLRLGATQLSLNKKWTPDFNLIASNKFLDGRLGLMMNLSSNTLANEAHTLQISQTAQQGYYRLMDFDLSPEKTYSYNPATVAKNDLAATTPVASWPMTGGTFYSNTPLDIVTRSANAKTKDDCMKEFGPISATDLAKITAAADRNLAQVQRGNEYMSCMNQWNDYTPSNIRNWVKKETDKKQNLDLRADFKVNNNLTVYGKASFNRRDDKIEQATLGFGNILINPSTTTQPNYAGPAFTNNTTTLTRSAVPGSGYYIYNSPSVMGNAFPYATSAVNIDPNSVTYDASHHLTKYTITDGQAQPDQIVEKAYTTGQYLQTGGTWKKGALSVEFFVADAKSDFERAQKRLVYTENYGPATLQMLPSGLWSYSFPSGNFDQADPLPFGRLLPVAAVNPAPLSATNNVARPGYTLAQQPRTTLSPTVFWGPQIRETDERTAKLDLTYATPESIPFFKRFKTGFNVRSMTNVAWDTNNTNSNGLTIKAAVGTFGSAGYIPGVYLPSANVRDTFLACQDTPGSLAPGGNACKYGLAANTAPLRTGQDTILTLTPAQFQNVITQSLIMPVTDTSFFNGAKNRPDNLINNWMGIDVEKGMAMLNLPNLNYDCVKRCTATDGKVYDQPVIRLEEDIRSAYVMGDFAIDRVPFTKRSLPFGLELEGNLGYRLVRTKVHGTGAMTFTSIAVNPTPGAYDPTKPTEPTGYITSSVIQNTSIQAVDTDFLPIYNLAMWIVPDKVVVRYNHAKTIARPPVGKLLPAGVCTYDERIERGDLPGPQRCASTIGNPALKARENVNQNLSVEYYPNKDTMFTVAALKQEGRVGEFITEGVGSSSLFAGSDLTDPLTGKKISALPFDYSTYVNGPVSTRRGFEFSTKAAFTFLPWLFRYTGFDANYTRVHSSMATAAVVDLITGDVLPPAKESKTQYNVALWYDDGRLSARIAVQGAAAWFNCIAGCGQNNNIKNYPAQGVIMPTSSQFPYSPGSPNFKDATRYVDGKIGFKLKPGVELFIEGRNLGNVTTTLSQGQYAPISGGVPNLLDYAYAGRRIMMGVQFRTL